MGRAGLQKDLYEKELETSLEENNYHNFGGELSENSNFRFYPGVNGNTDPGMDPDVKPMNPESMGPIDQVVVKPENSTENGYSLV